MTGRPSLPRRLLTLAALAAAGLAMRPAAFEFHTLPSPANAGARDTLRVRLVERSSRAHRTRLAVGAVVHGYLSSRGLPPVRGLVTVTDTGLVFHAFNGFAKTFPLVGPTRATARRQRRPSAISLVYVDAQNGPPSYLFRLDAGVFETDAPGPLLAVAAHPTWLDSVAPTRWTDDRPLVDESDRAALWATARHITTGTYADSLYALFGHPRAAVGLVDRRGRAAGRLGEYITKRDSLALDPGRMTGEIQLRHTLAHELGHRWQARAPAQLRVLWSGVRPIRDPKRYGYGDQSEHQAEAIAFAVNFLQTTATNSDPGESSLGLLDHYELLVPGTRTMVRYLALQPLYRYHPLRSLLTAGRR